MEQQNFLFYLFIFRNMSACEGSIKLVTDYMTSTDHLSDTEQAHSLHGIDGESFPVAGFQGLFPKSQRAGIAQDFLVG